MADVSEILDAPTAMAGDLQQGVKTLALDQEITFRLYRRVVLPIDGFVFWVRADLANRQFFQTSKLTTAAEVGEADLETEELSLVAKGSLHYTADIRQEEPETYAANRVTFTSIEEVQELNAVAPGTLWIGEFDGLRFAFSSLSARYRQAGIWHYSGFAVYPDTLPLVVDDIQSAPFSTAQVVSNSLPAWLAIAGYKPPWAFWGALPPLFPSFLVPDNEAPPFAAVHITPEGTRGLASAPTIDRKTSTHTQLCVDQVRITLWGARNDQALDFVDAVNRYSLDTGVIGIMNIPVVRDDKRTQSELGIIAMKKVIDFEVSYLQHRMNNVAQQVIKTCIPSVIPVAPR